MILNIITIIALTLAILFLIVLIIKPVEKFSAFRFDVELKEKVDKKNEQSRKESIEQNLIENDVKKRNTIDKIAEEVSKFETVLNYIKENINNIPVCREIDLRHDLIPDCSKRSPATCSLNNFCYVKTSDDKTKTCENKTLNPECSDILIDSSGNLLDTPSKMFVYPSVLEQIN